MTGTLKRAPWHYFQSSARGRSYGFTFHLVSFVFFLFFSTEKIKKNICLRDLSSKFETVGRLHYPYIFFTLLISLLITTKHIIEILSNDRVLLYFSLKLHAASKGVMLRCLIPWGTFFVAFEAGCVSDSSRESERINSVFNVSTLHAKQSGLSVKIASAKMLQGRSRERDQWILSKGTGTCMHCDGDVVVQ